MSVKFNQKGYIGQSMSVRAQEAYDNGEMPLSKWGKKQILDELYAMGYSEDKLLLLNKLTKKELSDLFLTYSSYHHMGKYANSINFYSVAFEKELTQEEVDKIIASRPPRKPREKKVKEPNLYITALVEYTNWSKWGRRYMKETKHEVVKFRTLDKLVQTKCGMKRLNSLSIIKKKVQKTRYAEKL